MVPTGITEDRQEHDTQRFSFKSSPPSATPAVPIEETWSPILHPPPVRTKPAAPGVADRCWPHQLELSETLTVSISAPQLRALRRSRFVALFYSRDRLFRFWFNDLRRLALFLSLMRESQWLRGDEPGCFSLASLAEQSQMSVARASQILSICTATGDFTRRWDPRDARYLVFDPSPEARTGLERIVAECCHATADLLDRPNPLPALSPEALRRVHKVFVDQALACLASSNLEDRALGSLTFFMAMADLALHSPVVMPDFVRREAARLQVTAVTLRNVLRRAERGGWVQKTGRMLSMAPEAQQCVTNAFRFVILHLAAVLDEADSALAAQTLPADPVKGASAVAMAAYLE